MHDYQIAEGGIKVAIERSGVLVLLYESNVLK